MTDHLTGDSTTPSTNGSGSTNGRSRRSSWSPTIRSPRVARPAAGSADGDGRAMVRGAGRGVCRVRTRLRLRPDRRWLAIPDRRGPDAVRRAVPPARSARPPVRCRARNARDHRLQAADLPRPDRVDPRRRPRRCAADAAGPGLHRRDRSRRRPGQAILFGTTGSFLEKFGLASLDDLPPIAEFIPSAEVVEALETGLRITPVIELSTAPGTPPES